MRTIIAFIFVVVALLGTGCAKGLNVSGAGGSIPDAGTGGTGGTGGTACPVGADAGGDAGAIPCVHASDCACLADACNIGACLNNVCVKSPSNEMGTCDDGVYCTDNDVCTKGTCAGTPKVCPGVDDCHVGMCDEATKTCTPMSGNDGASCTPTDKCFTSGQCAGGACLGTLAVNCSFLMDSCNSGICDSMGGCQQMPFPDATVCDTSNPCGPGACKAGICTPTTAMDGMACDDGLFDPCNPGACLAGTCTPMAAMDGTVCDDGLFDPCNPGACMAGTCTPVPNTGATCDDGLFCTINDTCHAGTCMGVPNLCGATTGCLKGLCDEPSQSCTTTPIADGTACTDTDVCNTGKSCKAGVCFGGTPANDGMACTPTLSCNTGTTCMTGMCVGGTGPTIYFQEAFNDNSKGWLLDPEWQIGPAQTCTCQISGNSDPSLGYPGSAVNGVAGVVLGGCEDNSAIHPTRYLTSPAFDTSGATGSVIFGYYRWLNSDYSPYMTNVVDVFDGTKWVNLWTSGPPPAIQDAAWTYFSFDVTAQKNAKMQVRFGFDIGSLGVDTVSGWNVDDILVANVKCP